MGLNTFLFYVYFRIISVSASNFRGRPRQRSRSLSRTRYYSPDNLKGYLVREVSRDSSADSDVEIHTTRRRLAVFIHFMVLVEVYACLCFYIFVFKYFMLLVKMYARVCFCIYLYLNISANF